MMEVRSQTVSLLDRLRLSDTHLSDSKFPDSEYRMF